MAETRLEEIRRALETEKELVERQLAEYGVPVDGRSVEVSMDEGFADSAQVTAERSEVLTLVRQQQAFRREIDAALLRITEGTYGRCEECGEEIPIERLEAVPTASLCVTCKQKS